MAYVEGDNVKLDSGIWVQVTGPFEGVDDNGVTVEFIPSQVIDVE